MLILRSTVHGCRYSEDLSGVLMGYNNERILSMQARLVLFRVLHLTLLCHLRLLDDLTVGDKCRLLFISTFPTCMWMW